MSMTNDEAKEIITGWLTENGHEIKPIEDEGSNFHMEIDYPLGFWKTHRVIQPMDYPGLILLLNGVAIAESHKEKLALMEEEEREDFYNSIRKELIFLDNNFDMNADEKGIIQHVQLSYEFYNDSLTKTQLFKGLRLNHKTLLYIITVLNDKFGIPDMPTTGTDEATPLQ